jgi:hypothetical protein
VPHASFGLAARRNPPNGLSAFGMVGYSARSKLSKKYEA